MSDPAESNDDEREGSRTDESPETGGEDASTEPAAGRSESDPPGDESEPDVVDVESLLNHATYVALVFAASGVGFGVAVFLLSQYGADATIVKGTLGRQPAAAFTEAIINIGITVALFFPLFLAPITGLVVSFSIEDDVTALFAATFGVLLGAVLFYVLAGYVGGLQYPTRTAARGGEYTYRFVLRRGVVNSALVGLVAGGVSGIAAAIGQRLE